MTKTKPQKPWIEWSQTATHCVAKLRGVSREIIPAIVERINGQKWISEVRAVRGRIVLYYVNASRGMVESLLRETTPRLGR